MNIKKKLAEKEKKNRWKKFFFAFIKREKKKKPTKITSAIGKLELNLAHNKNFYSGGDRSEIQLVEN